MTNPPDELSDKDVATIALFRLHDGEQLTAADVPRRAWPHLLRVITVPQDPPRNPKVQSVMDALAKSIQEAT